MCFSMLGFSVAVQIILWVTIHKCNCITVSIGAQPEWASYDRCFIPKQNEHSQSTVPIFTFCDPDQLVDLDSSHERGTQESHIDVCYRELQEKKINNTQVKTLLIFVESVTISNNDRPSEPVLDILASEVAKWFNLSTIPSFLVIVSTKEFEVKEWFSEPLRQMATSIPNEDDENRKKLYGHDKTLKTSVSLTYLSICDVLKSMLQESPGFDMSSSLWILFALVMTIGFVGFGVWLFKFNKNHPTDGDSDYEMEMNTYLSDSQDRSSMPVSDYILASTRVEAASSVPATSDSFGSNAYL